MSIYTKIRIIFFVAFIFVTALFVSFFYIDRSEDLQSSLKRYSQTSLFLHKHFRQSMRHEGMVDFSDDTVKLFLKESNFKLIQDKHKIEDISGHKLQYNVSDEARSGDHIWYVSDIRKFRNHYSDFEYDYDIERILKEMLDAVIEAA